MNISQVQSRLRVANGRMATLKTRTLDNTDLWEIASAIQEVIESVEEIATQVART